MGMDYRYAGSSSYPRFDRELSMVAEVFGGKLSDHTEERLEQNEKTHSLDYWFGFMSSDFSDDAKFVFPEGTDEIIVKWFNDIYGYFTFEETERLYNLFLGHKDKIVEISRQIWKELETSVEFNEPWSIYI